MDGKLVAWARAVKARSRLSSKRPVVPPLWLFTDAAVLPDPCAAARALPKGLAGIVLRHDCVPERAVLAQALQRICLARRLALVVAGDARLAARVGAGVHLRRGRRALVRPLPGRLATASAHDGAEMRRARLAGAALIFLSPVFPTASHPGAPALGVRRWASMARSSRAPVLALGGIDALMVRRLPRRLCSGAGAIRAFC